MKPSAEALRRIIADGLSSANDKVRLNAVVALAEAASGNDVAALVRLLQDEVRDVRLAAAAGLANTSSDEAIAPLVRMRNTDPDSLVRLAAVEALARLAQAAPGALAPLVETLKSNRLLLRLAAVMKLGELGPSARTAVPGLIDTLKDADWSVRKHAAVALGAIGGREALSAVVAAVADDDARVREAAREAVSRLRGT